MNDTKIESISGRALPLAGDDIDTDRIIPARFMKCITFDGLGEYAFYDERFSKDGVQKDHPMNKDIYKGASILIVGTNFGCGSSREHAPQALYRYGIRAIIGLSYADIFAGNCVSIGMPAIRVDQAVHYKLSELAIARPEDKMRIDLYSEMIYFKDISFPCTMDESARNSFILGLWDTTSLLLGNKDRILATADNLPYVNNDFN